MSRTRVIVRPKAQALPRMQEWVVERGWETFEVTCVEGHFFTVYRKLGLSTPFGEEFDPVVDMERGLFRRRLIRTFR